MLATEGLTIEFKPDSIDAMAELAAEANNQLENIGARRLMTVMECVFEQISFDAPDLKTKRDKHIEISAEFVAQGRFPIRVELDALNKDDFKRILVEPYAALTKQQQAMLATEGLTIEFKPDSIDAMAELAAEANNQLENIGARRLMTVMECVFEQISFDAPDLKTKRDKHIEISAEFVRERLAEIMKDEDLSKFVL